MQLTAEKWRCHVEEWERSGLPQKKFCQARGLSYSVFTTWRSILKKGRHKVIPVQSGARSIVPVNIVSVASASHRDEGMRLYVGDRYSIGIVPGFDQQTLRDVLDVLEG